MDIVDADFGFIMYRTEFYKFISIIPKLIHSMVDNHRSNELKESEVIRYLWTLQMLIFVSK
jgi:hypothetical protein